MYQSLTSGAGWTPNDSSTTSDNLLTPSSSTSYIYNSPDNTCYTEIAVNDLSASDLSSYSSEWDATEGIVKDYFKGASSDSLDTTYMLGKMSTFDISGTENGHYGTAGVYFSEKENDGSTWTGAALSRVFVDSSGDGVFVSTQTACDNKADLVAATIVLTQSVGPTF